MLALKKGLIKTDLIDKPQEINIDIKKVEYDSTLDLAANLDLKEKALLYYNQNDDINIYKNVNIADYLHKMQNEDHHFGNFTNAIYQKFKKIFLIQLQIKPTNFMPTSEINERQKLFS